MREPLKPLQPQHQIVLDWLCRQPAKVWDFAEVADATKIKRGDMEGIITDLRHQHHGSILSTTGPDGGKLRPRHAYLPASSKHRSRYPAVAPVPADAVEHPTIVAMRTAEREERERIAGEERERRARIADRGEVHEQYRARKEEARARAALNAKAPPDRFVTGYSPPAETPAVAAETPVLKKIVQNNPHKDNRK